MLSVLIYCKYQRQKKKDERIFYDSHVQMQDDKFIDSSIMIRHEYVVNVVPTGENIKGWGQCIKVRRIL